MMFTNEAFEPTGEENSQFSFGPAVAAVSVQRTPSNQSENPHRSLYRNPSGSQYRYINI